MAWTSWRESLGGELDQQASAKKGETIRRGALGTRDGAAQDAEHVGEAEAVWVNAGALGGLLHHGADRAMSEAQSVGCLDDLCIISQYQSEYRGLVEYYRKALNLEHLGKLRWVMEQSLTKTLGLKLKISAAQAFKRYSATVETPHGPCKGLQVMVPREGKKPLVATWGGVSLKREVKGWIEDNPSILWNIARSELLERLKADACELCGSTEQVQVHHIRALRDLQKPGQKPRPEWVVKMAARQRKTLVVCFKCHRNVIHHDGTRGTVART